MRFVVTAGLAGLVLSSAAQAGISFSASTFESNATAQTDAGHQYDFNIAEVGNLNAPGNYSFSQTGTALGFSSHGTVSVTHNTDFTGAGFHATATAHTFIADDFGAAVVSTYAEATALIVFNLDAPTNVALMGSLFGNPTQTSYQVQLSNANGDVFFSTLAGGSVSFASSLPSDTYFLSVFASATQQISHLGGDAYETRDASYDLTLTIPAPTGMGVLGAAGLLAVRRRRR